MARKLTAKQEAFRMAYLEKRNGREAYKVAYHAEGMSDNSIDVEVNKLLKHPTLGPMIAQGLERQAERVQRQADLKGLMTLEQHDQNLLDIKKAALADGKHDVVLKAEIKRGELRRYYVKQVEVGDAGDFSRMPDEDLDAFLIEEAEELGIGTRH